MTLAKMNGDRNKVDKNLRKFNFLKLSYDNSCLISINSLW